MKEPGPNTTPIKDKPSKSYKSSPPKKLVKSHIAAHDREGQESVYPDVTKEVSSSEMLEFLRKGIPEEFHNLPPLSPCSPGSKLVDCDYIQYLNDLSAFVRHNLGIPYPPLIEFIATEHKTHYDHPTGTQCRPDFIAVQKLVPVDSDVFSEESQTFSEWLPASERSPATPNFYWSQIEATGEIKSEGKTEYKAHRQAASYTGFLLQARPDLVSVLGIFVEPEEFRLLLTNACGVYYMKPVEWESSDTKNLLCAWIQRLYHPEVDESIRRSYEKPNGGSDSLPYFPIKPTFKIVHKWETFEDGNLVHKEQTFKGCTILKAGAPFNRRTTVFLNTNPQTSKKRVIKEQYIELTRRFEEGPILEKIHQDGRFPGVVQRESYGVVEKTTPANTNDESGSAQPEDSTTVRVELHAVWEDKKRKERKKTRLVMLDSGTRLTDVKTPQDVLILAYDLLEVIRHLYTKHGILHRDISMGNVLCRSEYLDVESTPVQDIPGMCFAAHLLGDKGPKSRAGRLDTKLMLIDFDMSQDCNQRTNKQPAARTGTFIYMARSVRSGKVSEGAHEFFPMPTLDPPVQARYEECTSGRLQEFPPDKSDFKREEYTKKIEPFQHKLAHDAESVFWVLLFWFMQAQPKDSEKDPLKRVYWSNFTGGDEEHDPRDNHFIGGTFPVHLFHKSYHGLEPLLKNMAELLKGDPEVLGDTDPRRTNDEYLVEAFQRLILNFLFKNHDQSFMKLRKHSNHRKVESETRSLQDLPESQLRSARGSNSRKRGSDTVAQDEQDQESVRKQLRPRKKIKTSSTISPGSSLSGSPSGNIP